MVAWTSASTIRSPRPGPCSTTTTCSGSTACGTSRGARSPSTLPVLPEKGVIRWFADPSAPSIAELRIAGHDVVPCVHLGPRPLLTGIDRVTYRIKTGRLKVIAGSAPDLVREATLYHYPDDRSGEGPIDHEKPVDRDNHSMDALRYLVRRASTAAAPFRHRRPRRPRRRRHASWPRRKPRRRHATPRGPSSPTSTTTTGGEADVPQLDRPRRGRRRL